MKAIVKQKAGPGLVFQELPVPQIKENEVLIKVHTTAICGTDVHIYEWNSWAEKTVPTPLIIGHEFMGHIAQVGAKVTCCKIGDRVSGEGHLTCGSCVNCRNGQRHLCLHIKGIGYHVTGCFAEYFVLPEENLILLSQDISDDVAAILDPLGNAVHTALSFDLAGEDVLITGAGPVGLLGLAVARHAGARFVVVTDHNDYRLAIAKKLGATATVTIPQQSILDTMKQLKMENGFTVGLEMSGSFEALNDLLHNLQPGGHVGQLGILPPGGTIDWDLVIFKMLTIKGIYGREIFRTWDKMLHFLQSGLDVTAVITHRFPKEQFQMGFEAAMSGQAAKVLLMW